jgi:hypothetical protein
MEIYNKMPIHHIVLLVSILVCWAHAGFAETLYLFQPLSVRPHVLEKAMSNACPDIDITVFGRYRDLQRKLKTDAPDALVTKAPLIEQIGGYGITLTALRSGTRDEAYVLLSIDTPVDPDTLAGSSIGVFDILGRRNMRKFVDIYLPASPKLKLVSKLEDLLPLLTFNMAAAILIPEHDVAYFQQLSQLHFVVTPLPEMRVGILALAIKDGGSAPITAACLKELDETVMALLGIEGWNEE